MNITIDILKKMAADGYITNTAIIAECEKHPELLNSINIYEYISQVLPGSYYSENLDGSGIMVKQVDNTVVDKIAEDFIGPDNTDDVGPIEIEPADNTDDVGPTSNDNGEEIKEDTIEPSLNADINPEIIEIIPEEPEIIVEEKNQVPKKSKKS